MNLASEFVAVGAAGKHFIRRLSRVAVDKDILDKAAGVLSSPRFRPRPPVQFTTVRVFNSGGIFSPRYSGDQSRKK